MFKVFDRTRFMYKVFDRTRLMLKIIPKQVSKIKFTQIVTRAYSCGQVADTMKLYKCNNTKYIYNYSFTLCTRSVGKLSSCNNLCKFNFTYLFWNNL